MTLGSNVDEFIRFPSEELLELCNKEQLLNIAEHYKVEISDDLISFFDGHYWRPIWWSGILEVTTVAASAEDSQSPL